VRAFSRLYCELYRELAEGFAVILEHLSSNSRTAEAHIAIRLDHFDCCMKGRMGRYFDTGPIPDTMKQILCAANLRKTPVVKEHLARMFIGEKWP
jgi:hypothetical protein